ncbi:MAG: hypothetical protein M1840_002757 [Geoglossum simile]|nr:MAG: hypothetical protein M1840_002757 [Geoglossum simile]
MSSSSSRPLLADDILSWTVADVMTRVIINVDDKENLTTAHMDKLRILACQRDELTQLHAVDAVELEEKLRNLSRHTSPASTVVPDPPKPEAILRARKDDYDTLILEGGIPYYYDPEDYSEHWPRATGYEDTPWSTAGLRSQLEDWRKFREYQQKVREDPEKFLRYQVTLHEYRREKGFESDVQLHRDLEQQTKLDNWKEYHGFKNYYKLQLERAVKRARERLEAEVAIDRAALAFNEKDLQEWNTVMDWIEQRTRTIASEIAVPNQEDESDHEAGVRGSAQISEQTASTISKGWRSSNKRRSNKRNRPTRHPVLGPILPPKIRKATKKTRFRLRKQGNVSRDELMSQDLKARLPAPVSSAPLRKGDPVHRPRESAMARCPATTLGSVRPPRVSKAARKTASRGRVWGGHSRRVAIRDAFATPSIAQPIQPIPPPS